MKIHTKVLMSMKDMGVCCFLETKTNNADGVKNMARKLGFYHTVEVNPMGFIGGLLLFWRSSTVDLEMIQCTTQGIHCLVRGRGRLSFRVTFAYVRPNRMAKDAFWADCKAYSNSFEGSWIIMGDFNYVASSSEQWGNENLNHTNINRFIEARDSCGLFDVNNSGPQLSWIRQIGGRAVLHKWLDMVM